MRWLNLSAPSLVALASKGKCPYRCPFSAGNCANMCGDLLSCIGGAVLAGVSIAAVASITRNHVAMDMDEKDDR